MVCSCKQCGKDFTLSEGEIAFFKSKGLSLPKRCKDCRKKNSSKNSKKSNINNFENKPVDTVFSYSSKKNAQTVFTPSQKCGIGTKPVIISSCLIIIALIGLFAVKHFKSNNYNHNEPFQIINTSEYFIQYESETEPKTEPPETSTYSQPTTTITVYTEQFNTSTQNNYRFRNNKLLTSHYQKHGIEMGFNSKESYEAAASAVISNPNAVSKPESDDNDGDMVYYIKSTGEIVFLSSDGYIRTYFIATEDYFNRQ